MPTSFASALFGADDLGAEGDTTDLEAALARLGLQPPGEPEKATTAPPPALAAPDTPADAADQVLAAPEPAVAPTTTAARPVSAAAQAGLALTAGTTPPGRPWTRLIDVKAEFVGFRELVPQLAHEVRALNAVARFVQRYGLRLTRSHAVPWEHYGRSTRSSWTRSKSMPCTTWSGMRACLWRPTRRPARRSWPSMPLPWHSAT